MSTLSSLPKTSSFTTLQPDPSVPTVDAARANVAGICNRPRQLTGGAFCWTKPEPRKRYEYLSTSPAALRDLGLAASEANSPEFHQIVSGESVVDADGVYPYAQAYAGWQFGQFAGQLGDGRVVNLFEIDTSSGRYEIQLKGAGKTPFLRFADGKAVLRSSVREYVISEALHAIGIPTTRALALTYLPETYAQRSHAEKCAIVARFAPSWIRFGTFDLYRYRGDRQGLRQLSDYVIAEVFHNTLPAFSEYTEDLGAFTTYEKMYLEIVSRNAVSVGYWQCYGFLNGVLNTDNTSVLGLAMDFGPFAIMDKFQPDYTPNHDDSSLRYGYRNTPDSIMWNCVRLGEDLAEFIGAGPLLQDERFMEKGITADQEDMVVKRATKVIEIAQKVFQEKFLATYDTLMGNRLGLKLIATDRDELFTPLLNWLEKSETDYNGCFTKLQGYADLSSSPTDNTFVETLIPKSLDFTYAKFTKKELTKEIHAWLKLYRERLAKQGVSDAARVKLAATANPHFLPRSWILDEVVEYMESNNCSDTSHLETLMKMALHPYDKEKWTGEGIDKKLVQRWMEEDVDNARAMMQCSCSS
ncbi:hypothetical protein BABINDRAFT_9669 [Babjeviella inositovora NRRL Y-12698]|uniref:Selenoprotein O n=1 Tax=Babjeviella inositovora NRRL Y-12698 TaxID=984486 RepID=A0A1E3QLV6_9ASCO|nr:uncharacterized protein BABINDRAFT_9669 [Babjeviella inositovora NRRL Y-12698]ODQ78062.1 hypothetical protein BABINDRAFT_9669 [Babjeviella inositovora NRRL Y-12698]